MKTKFIITVLSVFVISGLATAHAALVTVDNFSSVSTDGGSLSSIAGWSSTSGGNTATVSTTFGYGSAYGASVTGNDVYSLTLSGKNVLTAADGLLEYKLYFRGATTTDNYQQSVLMLAESGGVNGLAIQFNGGTKNGASDNYIQVSSGTGTGWGSPAFTTIPNSAWVPEHWYEITFRLELKTTGKGQDISGLVSVYDTVTSSFLIKDVAVSGIGSTAGAFDKIDVIQIKNNGTARAFETSTFRVGTVGAAIPEPSTWVTLAALFVLGMATFSKCTSKNHS